MRCVMPRRPRCRKICRFPDHWSFSCDETQGNAEQIVLSLDEYESIRLIDFEGMKQEQCAEQMGVARTTVTAIYDSARKKIARMIVEGRPLIIAGGCYRITGESHPAIFSKSPLARATCISPVHRDKIPIMVMQRVTALPADSSAPLPTASIFPVRIPTATPISIINAQIVFNIIHFRNLFYSIHIP